MEVVSKQMTRNILKDNNKQTSQSKRAHSTGDVDHVMMLQVVGLKKPNVVHVIKKVTYPHAVKVSKIFEKSEPRKVKAQEKVSANAKERVKVIAEQIRLIGVKPIKSANYVESVTNTGNRARLRTQLSRKLRMT